ncbi:hypothetical protein [Chitinophaga arvensicola]|uniref:Uncharacterized protein n=1 Tax=Chitinophaga arvensicola TaxID=29529 RepID=A0A1I0SDB3_9BACT|nr:hypothetical protein [Chitinophaga arvensicola]SEW55889.1 hypothetical protein SAMN04488122_6505 [Chitinophaga arvensicola]
MSDNKKLVVTIPAAKGTVDVKSATAVLKEAGTVRAEMKHIHTMVEKAPAPAKLTIPMKLPQGDQTPYRWIWSMLRTLTFKKTDVNDALKGPLVFPNFPKIVEGGGLGWLEPLVEGAEPTNSAAHGYFVAARGKPAVLSAEWREFAPNNDGKIITKGEKKFRESVQLHIYTRAMYGQEIKIFLMGHNMIMSDDNLPPWERTAGKAEIEKGKTKPDDAIKHFTRQVKITAILKDETTRGDALQVTDFVVKDKDTKAKDMKVAAGTITYQNFVQKVIVDVFLDDLWKSDSDSKLEIYPVVKTRDGKISKEFDKSFLKIKEDPQVKESPLMYGGNKPVLAGDIPTNTQRFQPCKYGMITVEDKDGTQTIFDENVLDNRSDGNRTFNIVAGSETAKKTIKLSVLSLVSHDDECTATPKHKGHVIDISSFGAKDYQTENPKAGIKREAEKESAAKGKFEIKANNYKFKRDTNAAFSGVIKVSDEELEFDAQYKYNFFDENNHPLFKRILGYLWIPEAQADHFPVTIQSCRWKHVIDFAVYPDIKWTAALAFNMEKADFDALKTKFAEANNGKGIKNALQRFTMNRLEGVEKVGKAAEGRFSKPTPVLDHHNEQLGMELGEMFALPKDKDAPAAPVKTKGKFAELLELLKEFDFSIKVEWNNDTESVDPIEDMIAKYYHLIKGAWHLVQEFRKIIHGDHTTKADTGGDDGKDPDEFIKKNADSSDKNIQGLIQRMQRKPFEYELQFPKLGLAASWYYETMPPAEGDSRLWGAGRTVLVKLNAKPLVGIDLKWDFLELLCRRHPIAYAILKAVDALLYICADDDSKVDVSVTISGKIDLEATFKHNTVGGNVFTRTAGSSAKKEELIKGGAVVSVKLECKLYLSKTATAFKVKVVVALGIGLEGSSGLGLQATIGSDNNGLYVGLDLIFEGIKIEGYVEAKVNVGEKTKEVKKKEGEPAKPAEYNKMVDVNPKASFEIGIDEKKISLAKMYLTKKEADG